MGQALNGRRNSANVSRCSSGNPGGLHRRELIRLVTDTLVVRYNGPSALADFNNPVFVLRVIEKVIAVGMGVGSMRSS